MIRAANTQIKNSKITGGNIEIQDGSLVLSDSEVNLGDNPDDKWLIW